MKPVKRLKRKGISILKANIIFIITLVIVVLIWYGSWCMIDENIPNLTNRGTFGDKFGFVNSLFSGLALAGIIYSIFLQQKELKETREEFIQQNFQTTFFNLMKNQNEITSSLEASVFKLTAMKVENPHRYIGRQLINFFSVEISAVCKVFESPFYYYHDPNEELDPYDEPLDEAEFNERFEAALIGNVARNYSITRAKWVEYRNESNHFNKAKIIYKTFFNKYHFVLGHYFRHIYHILKFLESSEEEMLKKNNDWNREAEIIKEYHAYGQFVQAQMSSFELMLLYYNCMNFEQSHRLMVKYGILDNLAEEDILIPVHNGYQGITLKKRSELIK
ncbi:MAG: hypothetical protein NT150_11880 [Bacteroidetes bacterium]|nr:hypothetical protein [Bacteroidota bacterium]